MCLDPASMSMASMVLTGVKVATALVQYQAQSEAYEAQAQAEQENYAQKSAATRKQYEQIDRNAVDQMSARAIEARKERARIAAVAGESGLTGYTGDRLASESDFNRGTDISALESNRRASLDQAYEEAKGMRAQSQSRINTITRPSLIGTGLQLAGAVAEAGVEQERQKRIGTNRRMPTAAYN